MRYTKRNIEDWDFRDCYPNSPARDVEADRFFGTHYSYVSAVTLARAGMIANLVEYARGAVEEDGENIQLVEDGDWWLRVFFRTQTRFTHFGRLNRRVIQALRRENRKCGHLRIDIMPPLPPGFQHRAR